MLVESMIAIAVAFAIVVAMGPFMIPWLKKLKVGNVEREELKSHQSKNGTPMMGGLMIIAAVTVVTVIYGVILKHYEILPVAIYSVAYGFIGFIDDYLKVVKKKSDGFKAWQKMLCQILVTGGFLAYMIIANVSFEMIVPFGMGKTVDMGFFAYPVLFLGMIGTANGVNFSDGVDGLCSSVTAVVGAFFGIICLQNGSELSIICGAFIGAVLGFLMHNLHPAKVFMGDTGSLALGGFVAAIAYMLQMPMFIVLAGLIYWVEILSVMLQVGYFKATKGKRIFRMAPIHHHFELGGWSETQVVGKFTIFTIFMSIIAYIGYVIR